MSIEEQLAKLLFPEDAAQTSARNYGAEAADLAGLKRIAYPHKKTLVRICDSVPAIATDLIRLIVDVENEAYDEGRGSGYDDAVNESAPRWQDEGRKAENHRIRKAINQALGGDFV